MFIFDYKSPADFKYAGAFFGSGKWRIGGVSNGRWSISNSAADTLALNTDYNVELIIDHRTAILSVGWPGDALSYLLFLGHERQCGCWRAERAYRIRQLVRVGNVRPYLASLRRKLQRRHR